jgi:opine dehydrogenase
MDTKITIIGAGNGGKAIAGYLAFRGYDIALYSPFESELESVEKAGGIRLQGEIDCFGKVDLVTTSIEKAISYADMILVVTPAFAHENIARNIAEYLTEKKSIILIPGHFGGILSFRKVLQESSAGDVDICIAETHSLPYACRVSEEVTVHIYGIKEKIKYSMYNKRQAVVDDLSTIFPKFVLVPSILETGISDLNPVLHPITTILNLGKIDRKEQFKFYMDGVTPKIAMIIKKIDQERLSIAKALEISAASIETSLKKAYRIDGDTLYDILHNNQAYYDIWAPSTTDSRYITEDVPYGLVPLSAFGSYLKLHTPIIDSVIVLANSLYNQDFKLIGRTFERMGLDEKMGLEEMKNIGM